MLNLENKNWPPRCNCRLRFLITPCALTRYGTQDIPNNTEGLDMKAPFLVGRLLFAGFFINSGISHLQKSKELAEYARAKGVPAPELAVALSAVPLLAGGASILLGVKPKLGAMAILGFLAGVSPVILTFGAMRIRASARPTRSTS